MSYPNSYGRNAFFEPIMNKSGTSTLPMAAVNLAAANGTHGEFICVKPCTIRYASFSVTTEAVVGTTTAPYVVLTKYSIPAAGGTSTVIGTITVPNGAAVGKVYYKKDLSTALKEGEVIQVKWVIAVGGSVAGIGHVSWQCEPSPGSLGDNTNLVVSST